jgi:hypothetical protein
LLCQGVKAKYPNTIALHCPALWPDICSSENAPVTSNRKCQKD